MHSLLSSLTLRLHGGRQIRKSFRNSSTAVGRNTMDSSKPSSSLAESLPVDSDFEIHRHIPYVPRVKGFGEVKQIELQDPVKPHEVIHHGTFGIREEAAAAYDDAAAALHFKGPKAKLKGKLHPQPSTAVPSPSNGINHVLTSPEPGTSKTCDGIMSSRKTPGLLSTGNGQNTILSPGSGYHITTPTGGSSEIRTTSGIFKFPEEFCQRYPATMLPCQTCQSTNTKFCYYDISSREPRYLCKDCRILWNPDVSELNFALIPDQISIEVPAENEIAPTTLPGDNITQTISVFKAFINGRRARLQRLLGVADSKLVGILVMVTAEIGIALVTYGSGASTLMMPTQRILLDVAGICSVLGFLCCLYSLLLRGVNSRGAKVFAGLGLIAGVTGFLVLMGMLWHENLKLYVAAAVACIALLTALALSFFK